MWDFWDDHLEEEDLKRMRAVSLQVDSVLIHHTDPDQDPAPAGQLAHCSQSRGWKF